MKFKHASRQNRDIMAFGLLILGLLENRPVAAEENLMIFSPAYPGGALEQISRALKQTIQTKNPAQKVMTGYLCIPYIQNCTPCTKLSSFMESGSSNSLMVSSRAFLTDPHTQKTSFNLTQATPIARLTGEYEVIVVPTNSKIHSMKELVTQFKAAPSNVVWGGGSAGGMDHILVGMITQAAGINPDKINYVAYPGIGAMQASILAGNVTSSVSSYGEFESQIKAGRLRALAISSPERVPGIDIPTLKEQGVNVELFNWRAIVAPPGITDKQRMELIELVEQAIKSPAWKETLKKNAWNDMYLAGNEFKSFFDAEQVRIANVIEALGLTANRP